MNNLHTGSCLCGSVRFRISGHLRGVVYCHCWQCRKQTGHFVAATNAQDADIAIEGEDKHRLVRRLRCGQTRILWHVRIGLVLETQ